MSDEAAAPSSWEGSWTEGCPEKPLRPGSKLEVAFKYLKVWTLAPSPANPQGSRKIQCQVCENVLKYDNHMKDASNLLKHFNNTRPDHQRIYREIQACETAEGAAVSEPGTGEASTELCKPKAKRPRSSTSKSRRALTQEQIQQQEQDAMAQAPELRDWLETVQLKEETKRKILVWPRPALQLSSCSSQPPGSDLREDSGPRFAWRVGTRAAAESRGVQVAFVSEEIFNLSTLRSIQVSELERSFPAWSELKIGAKATLTVALDQLKASSA